MLYIVHTKPDGSLGKMGPLEDKQAQSICTNLQVLHGLHTHYCVTEQQLQDLPNTPECWPEKLPAEIR